MLDSLTQQRRDTVPGSALDQALASRIAMVGATDQYGSFRPEVSQAGRYTANLDAAQRNADTGNVRVGALPDMTQQRLAEEFQRASTTGVLAMGAFGVAVRHDPTDVANVSQVVDQTAAIADMEGAFVAIRDTLASAQNRATRGAYGARPFRAGTGREAPALGANSQSVVLGAQAPELAIQAVERAQLAKSAPAVVDIQLKYKSTWNAAQRAEADAKVKVLNAAETVVTEVTRSGTSTARYRRVNGPLLKGYDVDHTVDLQLGGADSLENMLPLNSSVNRSLGSQRRPPRFE